MYRKLSIKVVWCSVFVVRSDGNRYGNELCNPYFVLMALIMRYKFPVILFIACWWNFEREFWRIKVLSIGHSHSYVTPLSNEK